MGDRKWKFPSVRLERQHGYWFAFYRYWSGRLWYLTLFGFTIILDFRRDFISDMTNGRMTNP